MLVLQRKPDERILLTGGIRLTVVSIREGKVRVGIEAPAGVYVLREEIASPEQRAENEEARS